MDDDVRAVSAERAEELDAGVQKRTEVLFADLPRVITYRFMPQPSTQHFDRRPLSREEKDRWKAAQAEEGRLAAAEYAKEQEATLQRMYKQRAARLAQSARAAKPPKK